MRNDADSRPFLPSLAIVGMGCRFPGGVSDVESFWELLAGGRSGIVEVPSDRWDRAHYYHPNSVVSNHMVSKWGGFIEDIDKFDARFWGISPREASRMDPQQRWLLEVAWEAIEDAGTRPSCLAGTNTAVFVGVASHDYSTLQTSEDIAADVHTNSGSTLSIASNRVSYLLDFKGPSVSVDTACSSSLVAVTLACRSIWSGESDAALAGGANAVITPHATIGFSRASMLSPTGQCFAFDSRANGYVRGEGAGMVFIKPLDRALRDGDRIYALIRAAVVNQDGHTSSMTVPGVEGQSAMLREAYRQAGIAPSEVVYMEAHGTGTPVGDPIEVTALGNVLSQGRSTEQPCLMGSVKTNIGHLEAGSGIAGLIKAALVLHKDSVPPSLNFETPNPNIPFDKLRLEVATALRPLPHRNGEAPVSAVNSFGFGGTNSHVVVQAAPPSAEPRQEESESSERADRPYVLPISARDDVSLRAYAKSFRALLADEAQPLADVCYSAGARKEQHHDRLVVIGRTRDELRSNLAEWLRGSHASGEAARTGQAQPIVEGQVAAEVEPIVFVFTGQGAQWWAMGRQLLEREPIFRRAIEQVDALLRPLAGWSVIEEMTRSEETSNINQTAIAQPAIFALQVGLVELWKSWGIVPAKVVGHSVGEVAAAYCAGIYSLEDAVRVIYHRSRLQDTTGGRGRMLAAGISAAEGRTLIGDEADRVHVAAINSSQLITLAGDTEPLEAIAAKLEEAGKFARWLRVNYAFHTHQMEPIRDDLLSALEGLAPRGSRIPFISTVTGGVLSGEKLTADYWWRNVRHAVLFGPAVTELIEAGERLFLEVGPHPALLSSVNQCLADEGQQGAVFHSLRREADESLQILANLAGLHIHGVEIDWAAVNQTPGRFVRLPRYPWRRDSHWIDVENSVIPWLTPDTHPLLGRRITAPTPTWQFDLDASIFDYLNDHQFWDSIVFPAAGYGEMGIALSRELFPDKPHVVEDLDIKGALFVSPEDVSTVRVVFEPTDKSFQVFSSSGKKEEWKLHAQGRLTPLPAEEPPRVDLNELRAALPAHADHDRYYAEFAAAGYQFGPRFQHLQNVWSKPGEALAEVVVPEDVAETVEAYHFHPAVLDACFHTFKGVQDLPPDASPDEQLFLPEHMRRIRMYCDKPPQRFWSHAKLRMHDGKSLVADIYVYDDEGRRLADILGFRADLVDQKRPGDDLENELYQFRWEPCRLRGSGLEGSCHFAGTGDVVSAAREATPQIYEKHELAACYQQFFPRQDDVVRQIIENAYVQLGWSAQAGEVVEFDALVKQLGIVPQHHRLARAELRSLEPAGVLEPCGEDRWRVLREPAFAPVDAELDALEREFPRFASGIAVQRVTVDTLADVLRGEVDPIELLFPGGSSELLEKFYVEGAGFPAFNELIPLAVSRAIEELPPRRALRVLEVGAGTGSLTRAVLPVLPQDRTEYAFTDIGPAFLAAAKKQFQDLSFIDYHVFDVEQDPASQGLQAHGYDLILVTNVLHATSDLKQTLANLRRCLASGGVLMFLEVVRQRPAWDNTFGLLKGWWQYTDTELRKDSALLSRPRWEQLLGECGFLDATSYWPSLSDQEDEQAVLVARGPELTAEEENAAAGADASTAEETSASASGYLVFADAGGVADALIERLRAQDNQVVRVRVGEGFAQHAAADFSIHPDSEVELRRVLAEAFESDAALKGIVHCWSLDHSTAEGLTTDTLAAAQSTGVLQALKLGRALAGRSLDAPPRIFLVTRDAQAVEGESDGRGIASSPLIGFSRVANNEHFAFRWTTVDLDPQSADWEVDDLLQEIVLSDRELEVAYRGGRRLAHRLHRTAADEFPKRRTNAVRADGTLTPYRLETDKPGILTNLALSETRRREPGPGEIEVRLRAGGINFRDVMKALGMYPGNPIDLLWFGDDFSGVVERVGPDVTEFQVGDAVAGMAPYSFRAYSTFDRRMAFRKPPQLSYAEAATLPTVFLTAHYALVHLARMQRGEKILIHAGTGGVGQAAIQIAQHLGLEVFATAGTPQKRQMLADMGVPHVMNSRTLDFADEVMEITGGRGVDAVLNSLAGDFIPKSISVLAPFGRFLEIGKVDVYNNTKIGLEPLRNNISYFVIDLAQHLEHRPDYVAGLFGELVERFEAGDYRPLTHQVFPITDVVEAFRHMAQGKHVGKNVLSFEADEIPIGPCREEGHLFRPQASYLITGGASGFGLEIVKWMARQGARHLVLMSRSGPRDEQAAADIEQLRNDGIDVVDARGDVTRLEDVQRIVDEIERDLPPLAGVIHGAMVLDDDFLLELSDQRFNAVLHPKLLGAWNLHSATRSLPLDHFLSFSSFSCVVGGPRQSNYNAGNYFLDQLSHYRRAHGLPALTFNWTAISGAGFVHRNEKTAQYLDKLGMKSISVDEALRVIQRTLALDPVQVAVCRADWPSLARLSQFVSQTNIYSSLTAEQKQGGGSLGPRIMAASPEEREGLVEDFVAEQVANVFGVEASQVDRDTPLPRLGLDSLMAIDLMNRVEGELAMSLPMGNMLSGASVRDLAQTVLRLIAESGATATADDTTETAATGAVPLKKLSAPTDEFPLSAAQSEIWLRSQAAPQDSAQQATFAARFSQLLDVEQLRRAFADLARRHSLLTARIFQRDGEAWQQLLADAPLPLHVHDASSETNLPALLAERAARPFDVEQGPLARLELFQTSDSGHVVLLTAHALAADALSMAVLFDELMQAYRSPESDATPPWKGSSAFAYQDFAAWEREHVKGDAGRRAAAFWKEHLAGAPLELPDHHHRTSDSTSRPRCIAHGFRLDDRLTQSLLDLAAEQNVSLKVVFLSALEVLLHHDWERGDIVVGCSLAGRRHRELRRTVGPFSRTVPLRSRVDGPLTMLEMLQRNKQLLESAAEHLTVSSPLAASADDAASLDQTPHFQVTFAMEHAPGVDDRGLAVYLLGQTGRRVSFGDLTFESVSLQPNAASSDLELSLHEVDGEVIGCWRCDPARYDAGEAARLHQALERLLRSAVARPQQDIADFELFGGQRRIDGNGAAHAPTFPVVRPATPSFTIDFEAEARLDPSITAPENRDFDIQRMDRVLLTGATGFLGAFLLDALLERTEANIVCLVRAGDAERGLQRVRDNLAGYGLDPSDFDERVDALVGDLSKPLLGLSQQQFQALGEQIDVIYHNGADVNLGMPYDGLRATNVQGTQEILRLACTARLKPTHFVSTFTVLATSATRGHVVHEDDPLPKCEELLHGYSQTKWVSERLIAEARSRGVPVSIYRPGHISGHSATGASNTGDLLHSILLACWRLGAAPSRGGDLDMTPVDYVAQGIVELSSRPECLGGTYHLTNPVPLKHQVLLDFLRNQQLGVRIAPYDQWRDRLLALTAQAPVESTSLLVATMVPDEQVGENGAALALHPIYDCRAAASALAPAGLVCAPCDEQLLTTYLSYTRQVGMLPEDSNWQAVRTK